MWMNIWTLEMDLVMFFYSLFFDWRKWFLVWVGCIPIIISNESFSSILWEIFCSFPFFVFRKKTNFQRIGLLPGGKSLWYQVKPYWSGFMWIWCFSGFDYEAFLAHEFQVGSRLFFTCKDFLSFFISV